MKNHKIFGSNNLQEGKGRLYNETKLKSVEHLRAERPHEAA